MFHKVKAVNVLPDHRLNVQFFDGQTKVYDMNPLFAKWAAFKVLEDEPGLFAEVRVDAGGYGIIWNDDLDLSCDELYANGEIVKSAS